MVSDFEELYQALLTAGMSEEEIEREVKKKASSLGSMMSTEAILFLLAKDLGLILTNKNDDFNIIGETDDEIDYDEFTLNISEIEEGMSNIILAGRIERINPFREFKRKDGSQGIVASFTLNDSSGKIKVVLWDQQIEIMKNEYFVYNEIVRIIGGYSKIGRNDMLEIHLGKKGKIELAPPKNRMEKIIPKLNQEANNDNTTKFNKRCISELVEREGFLPAISGVVHIENFSEKNLKDGGKSFLMQFYLDDGTAKIPVIVWGMNAVKILKLIKDGDKIYLSNVVISVNSYTNLKQVHFTKKTFLKILL